MKALDFPLLADENVHPDVIVFLQEAGLDVKSVAEQGSYGIPDTQVLQQATESGRAVLTHDSDFGGLYDQNDQCHSRQCPRCDSTFHPRR